MSLRIGFGYEQPEPGDAGLYIYDDVTGSIIASVDTEPSHDEKSRLVNSLIVTDASEIEHYLDSKTFIRMRDNVLVDRHGNEIKKL